MAYFIPLIEDPYSFYFPWLVIIRVTNQYQDVFSNWLRIMRQIIFDLTLI